MIKITKNLLEKLYITEEKSFRSIAEELEVSKSTIEFYLKKFEIPRRGNLEISRKNNFKFQKWAKGLSKETDPRIAKISKNVKKAYKEKRNKKIENIERKFGKSIKEILEQFYIDKKLSLKEISKLIGFDRSIVSELLDSHNIKKRNKWEYISSLKGSNHSQYGKSWEEIRGNIKAKEEKRRTSMRSRKLIMKRLKNNEIPFNKTKIERIMKEKLEELNVNFIEQYSIDQKFICDFAIPHLRIIIECDGDYWHANPKIYNRKNLHLSQIKNLKRDKYKDVYLAKKGWRIIRFYETEIKEDINSCMKTIIKEINLQSSLRSLINN